MSSDRAGVGEYFLEQLSSFAAERGRYPSEPYQRAAEAIDEALAETMKYIREEEAGRKPHMTRDELAELWQAASRTPVNQDLAMACLYKALGWIRAEEWETANQLGISTDLQSIQAERVKLIRAANLDANPPPVSGLKRLKRWITEEERRKRLTFIGAFLVVIIGGLWTIFVYFDGKARLGWNLPAESTTPSPPSPVP